GAIAVYGRYPFINCLWHHCTLFHHGSTWLPFDKIALKCLN
ncbi:hypothetical protein A2U01_0067960, partial [Trifolium medium]|nr:hypothetical protein [Trifolium medium]